MGTVAKASSLLGFFDRAQSAIRLSEMDRPIGGFRPDGFTRDAA